MLCFFFPNGDVIISVLFTNKTARFSMLCSAIFVINLLSV